MGWSRREHRQGQEQLAPERIAETFFSVMSKMDKDNDEEISSDELLVMTVRSG